MARSHRFILAVVALASTVVSAQSAARDDRDGKSYPVVEIAGRKWMARNLEFATPDSSCPRDESHACATEGRLYPWATAIKACPSGWHLSTEEEWQALELALGVPTDQVGQDRERGKGAGERLKIGGSSGLNFPFAGWRRPDGAFRVGNGNDRAAAIWTATKAADGEAWHRDLSSMRTGIWRSPVGLDYRLSVRCVQDGATSAPRPGEPRRF